jgi:hypothetical protein
MLFRLLFYHLEVYMIHIPRATYITTLRSTISPDQLLKNIVEVDCQRGGAIIFTRLPFFDTFQKSLPQ